jgi:hypothetical protein
MASNSKQKTTMAKLARERTLRERREIKQAKKATRRREAAASAGGASEAPAQDPPSNDS